MIDQSFINKNNEFKEYNEEEQIEIQEKINQSKTYETNEINNDDPMRSEAF